jgi:lipopolysaccharide biosynthesis glycosyltransferase
MGQIFHACVYDTEKKKCSVIDADKFHANCYSCSGTVAVAHYLLRKKAYHVMWGGGYVVIDNFLSQELSEDILLGISTYMDREGIESNSESNRQDDENYRNNVEFVIKNTASWKEINVWNKAIDFFDYENTHSVKYDGFLVDLWDERSPDSFMKVKISDDTVNFSSAPVDQVEN